MFTGDFRLYFLHVHYSHSLSQPIITRIIRYLLVHNFTAPYVVGVIFDQNGIHKTNYCLHAQ